MYIDSISNKNIKEIRKLSNKKYSLSKALFVIEGDHAVKEAIKNNRLVKLYKLESNPIEYDFPTITVSPKVMKSISDLPSTPKVIGIAKIESNEVFGNKIVILDNIQDPGNAGTIIRTCAAFGVDTIIFSTFSVSPYNDKVVRSTEGMIFNINIIIDEIEDVIKTLKDKNIKIYGTSLETNKELKDIKKEDKFAIVFGNEGSGVRKEILSLCDEVFKIDMNEKCESLNVSVTSGIILYEFLKDRKIK